MRKVKKDHKTGCWNWIGAIFKKKYGGNYGQLRMGGCNGRVKKAHRLSYEYFIGQIPDGLEIDHLCRNTLCVNPDHLKPVTHIENCRRRRDSGLPSCKYGHKYTPETTYIRPDNGRRECKICMKVRQKSYNML
jgi:hypothetical protein